MHTSHARLAWTAFGVSCAIFMLSFFHRVAPAAIVGELQQSFDVGAAALGALAATYFYAYFAMQIPVGVLVDTLGPRRVLTAGAIVAGLGSIAFGLAPTFAHAIGGRALVGIGVSVVFIALMKLAADWFSARRFASVTAVGVFAGNVGAVLAAAPLAAAAAWTSWRNVFVAVGVLSFALAVLAWTLVRDGPEARSPDPRNRESGPSVPWHRALAGVIANREIWPGCVAMLGGASPYITFIGLWAMPYLTQAQGMTRAEAANHTSVALFSFAVGSLFVAQLSDRLGRRRPVLIGGLALFALSWTPLLVPVQLVAPASYLLFAVMGVASTSFTLCWACAKEVSPPRLAGMGTSVVNTGQFLGVGLLQPAIGWLLDRGWQGAVLDGVRVYSPEDYRLGIALLFAFSCLGLAGAVAIRETHCRNVHSDRESDEAEGAGHA